MNINDYALREPPLVRIDSRVKPNSRVYLKSEETGYYESNENRNSNMAVILCAGQIGYDAQLGNSGRFGDAYSFYPHFSLMRECLKRADFTVGNFTAMSCDHYLSTERFDPVFVQNPNYCNARIEYLEALKNVGFDCLAAANMNNLDTGTEGVLKTEDAIMRSGMQPTGIGREKGKIFNVNGIRIGVLSYTNSCAGIGGVISQEGADALLNIYEPEKAKGEIAAMKEQGAHFVLVYFNCGSMTRNPGLVKRQQVGTELAEAGADYVICTTYGIVSKYLRYETSDGRTVPIATSPGNFMTGIILPEKEISVLLKLTLFLNPEGKADCSDEFIPLKQFETKDGVPFPIVPAMRVYYPDYQVSDFQRVIVRLKQHLGSEIPMTNARRIFVSRNVLPQLTYGEVYEILGAKPSENDKKKLDLNKKAPIIVGRSNVLKKDAVAVRIPYSETIRFADLENTYDKVTKAGAALYVSRDHHDELPTIVVSDGEKAYRKLAKAIRDKYDPFVVAVTGSVGKTTTKDMISAAFDTQYRSLHVVANNNTIHSVGNILQNLTTEDQVYIQELDGSVPENVRKISNIIQPDVAIITSIDTAHLLLIRDAETTLKEKLGVVAGLKEGGALVLNGDNQYLKSVTADHPYLRDYDMTGRKIIRYSASNPDCDYYARNVKDYGNKIEFQIVSKVGKFDVVLNMQGIHNVQNAVGAFACAVEGGVPPYKIIAALGQFNTSRDRQNLVQCGGYSLLLDTYSVAPLSLETAMKTLSEYPGNMRKIAVLGDVPWLGRNTASEEKHKEIGEHICKYNFDYMFCFGHYSKYYAEEAEKRGKNAYFSSSGKNLCAKIAEVIRPGDLILYKGDAYVHFKQELVYPLFGPVDQ